MFKRKAKNPFKDKTNLDLINWKSVEFLRTYTTRFGTIKPRRFTGLSVSHQKKVRQAIIRAREL
jgi:ribosomal protein S18